jgi:hypothetical protein
MYHEQCRATPYCRRHEPGADRCCLHTRSSLCCLKLVTYAEGVHRLLSSLQDGKLAILPEMVVKRDRVLDV